MGAGRCGQAGADVDELADTCFGGEVTDDAGEEIKYKAAEESLDRTEGLPAMATARS